MPRLSRAMVGKPLVWFDPSFATKKKTGAQGHGCYNRAPEVPEKEGTEGETN